MWNYKLKEANKQDLRSQLRGQKAIIVKMNIILGTMEIYSACLTSERRPVGLQAVTFVLYFEWLVSMKWYVQLQYATLSVLSIRLHSLGPHVFINTALPELFACWLRNFIIIDSIVCSSLAYPSFIYHEYPSIRPLHYCNSPNIAVDWEEEGSVWGSIRFFQSGKLITQYIIQC